jgi:glutamate--cysteine ligase
LTLSLTDYIDTFSQTDNLAALAGIGRGIEREALRVLPEGKLSEQGHFYQLGSALTHSQITTDYSETLLEFITPVSYSAEQSIAQLQDIQKYTFEHIQGELLWPMSMPCFVDDAEKISLAQYGTSNIGKMKTAYRQGLKNRYGSMMQVISGIHFNFSFSQQFWQVQYTLHQKFNKYMTEKVSHNNDDKIFANAACFEDFISERYFSILRNYKRFCWLIPYLFGSSPAICSSFLQGKEHKLPFKKSPFGALYLEYATSLRMSDLGYTSSEQSDLKICYNNLQDYVDGVQQAIKLKSKDFSRLGIKVNGEYQQLNDNVLQIENELYAPIRPKRVAKSGEKPSVALGERGVEYIEVRALDVNPFSDTGISLEQVHFLDIFITFCAFIDNQDLDCSAQQVHEKNMDDVVMRGRDPNLQLSDSDHLGNVNRKSIPQWGNELFEQMQKVATLLDKAYGTSHYSQAISREQAKINDSSLTPSAQLLEVINKQSLSDYALKIASDYSKSAKLRDYQFYDQAFFEASVPNSHKAQDEIEASDTLNFDDFLIDYFA